MFVLFNIMIHSQKITLHITNLILDIYMEICFDVLVICCYDTNGVKVII